MNNAEHKAKYPLLTLDKTIEIMKYMSEHASPEGVTITELSEELNLSKNNVHRILDTLLANELVDRVPGKQSYMLGWGLFELSKTVPIYHNINTSNYMEVMSNLCINISESVQMGICSGNNECIILCKVNPNRSTLITTQVGSVQPLHVASLGKVFMSGWNDEQIIDYFNTINLKKPTSYSIDNAAQMIKECQQIRRCGYALDNEENLLGIRCIAMPVKDYTESIVAAISITAPVHRMPDEQLPKFFLNLQEACKSLSARLGYRSVESLEFTPYEQN